jgi:hypothetical protein
MALFFVLGFTAARLKSDPELPEGIGKGLSLCRMLAIGFKGSVETCWQLLEHSIGIVYLSDVEAVRDAPF